MTESAGPTRRQPSAVASRAVWVVAAAGVGGVGAVAALFLPTPVPAFGVFLAGATLAVAMSLPFVEHPAERPSRWFELALAAGVTAVAVQGVTALAGWWTLPVVLLLAGTCPWLTEAFARSWAAAAPDSSQSEPEPTVPTVPPGVATGAGPDMSLFEVMLEEVDDPSAGGADEADDPTLHTLDVDQLCRLWRASFARLREAPTSDLVLAVTRERDDLLRELSRRDPEGVAAWLADRPRATGDPRRYLRRTRGG